MTHYAFTPRHIAAMNKQHHWKFWINSSTWLYNTGRRVQLNRYPFQFYGNLSLIRASSSKFPVLHPILHSWQQPLSAVAKLFLNSPETLLVSNPQNLLFPRVPRLWYHLIRLQMRLFRALSREAIEPEQAFPLVDEWIWRTNRGTRN